MKFPSGRENKGKIKSSPGQNNHWVAQSINWKTVFEWGLEKTRVRWKICLGKGTTPHCDKSNKKSHSQYWWHPCRPPSAEPQNTIGKGPGDSEKGSLVYQNICWCGEQTPDLCVQKSPFFSSNAKLPFLWWFDFSSENQEWIKVSLSACWTWATAILSMVLLSLRATEDWWQS